VAQCGAARQRAGRSPLSLERGPVDLRHASTLLQIGFSPPCVLGVPQSIAGLATQRNQDPDLERDSVYLHFNFELICDFSTFAVDELIP